MHFYMQTVYSVFIKHLKIHIIGIAFASSLTLSLILFRKVVSNKELGF